MSNWVLCMERDTRGKKPIHINMDRAVSIAPIHSPMGSATAARISFSGAKDDYVDVRESVGEVLQKLRPVGGVDPGGI
jgi:hypothetical protein